MHRDPRHVLQRGQDLPQHQLAPISRDHWTDDLPVTVDEEHHQGDELDRAGHDHAGCGPGRRQPQGGNERAQAAIGCPPGEDNMLAPVDEPDGGRAQDGRFGHESCGQPAPGCCHVLPHRTRRSALAKAERAGAPLARCAACDGAEDVHPARNSVAARSIAAPRMAALIIVSAYLTGWMSAAARRFPPCSARCACAVHNLDRLGAVCMCRCAHREDKR
jgi:hypothetical protein